MFDPVATYRIQFHKDFTFKHLVKIIPYLKKLGVSTIYASPIFAATPGSNHGYDVTDPHRINPEIGTLDELRAISKDLKQAGINWLQDIVPNHMAFHPGNHWLMDVMEKGQRSAYASFFDIIWDVPDLGGKLMVPFLGSPLQQVISDKQLSVIYHNGGFKLSYGDQAYPVNLSSYRIILQTDDNKKPDRIKKLIAEKDIEKLKAQLADAYREKDIGHYVNDALKAINNDNGLLQKIANEQYYQLSFWADSDHQINYRRFFTVNGLICLNIQHDQVFDHYHQFIKALLNEDIFQGLRVDHIDGLYDPATYLQRLRALAGDKAYIVVEKILEEGEKFPSGWPVQGNTGYDFLASVNNVLTFAPNKKIFTDHYKTLLNDRKTVGRAILDKKANILYKHMAGELNNLYHLLAQLELVTANDIKKTGADDLKTAIGEFLIRCPVYRYYGNSFPLSNNEAKAIKTILDDVQGNKPGLKKAVGVLQKILLKKHHDQESDQRALRFYQRCMQFTGPLMAKGVEDTLMYTYDRFIAHNEVGDSPAMFGMQVSEFHRQMAERQQNWPLSINATSTHDTKRGEDVRAKLNVLTGLGEEWITTVKHWQKLNEHLISDNAPDTNDEYLIYQTLTGFYPMPGDDDHDVEERLQAYLTKALREAKTHTQWAEPNEAYEQNTLRFAAALLDKTTPFWESFTRLQAKIADHAVVNSLTQVLLKFTCPGIPDVYQGCELWDLSLVDPDNRRPVNYDTRAGYIDHPDDIKTLWNDRYTGKIKQWLIHKLFCLRRNNTVLFTRGNYIPLKVTGKYHRHIIAFARQHADHWLIVVAPLHLAALITDGINDLDWDDTVITIPDDAPLQWDNVLSGKQMIISERLNVKDVFGDAPVAVITSAKTDNSRGAGIIMHITSLPSPFGIGDMGPQARQFADFLSRAGQKYWQLLPLNPTSPAAYHSPYSSVSSMAGNVLLISPDDLAADGLLQAHELPPHYPATGEVNYQAATDIKAKLLNTAFERHRQNGVDAGFNAFIKKEAYWLDDFALYEVLKAQHGLPWYQWPAPYKCRDKKIMEQARRQYGTDIEKIKWAQYLFFKQWRVLKKYVNDLGISLIGDMPFYVSYDSADVWVHPEIFKLDKDKGMAGIAGVPPDYFNDEGQLWGMPVYNWDKLKETDYQWWADRISKNLQFFDLIRLDHFRAFYDYWEVPAGDENAINGIWRPGPGADFFKAIQKRTGDLPFIAEDLGEITNGVYQLRDQFNLPGMHVLQFAFGADMPVSIHTPHNHRIQNIAYTGTHDNNTAAGWYEQDATRTSIDNLSAYAGTKITARNVHQILIKLCYASTARIAITPMQDVLGSGKEHRMNTPAKSEGNWLWQLKPGQLTAVTAAGLKKLVRFYNR